jgi:DNA-binding response OmpR family regulator
MLETTQFRHTLLVVEDNKKLRMLLVELLGNHYNVVATDSGEKVVELVLQHKPIVILLDVMLNGMVDGFSVLRLLKQDMRFQDISVIIISGLDQSEFIEKGLSLGANDYITKPLSIKVLESKVENLIKLRNAILQTTIQQQFPVIGESKDKSSFMKTFETLIEDMITNDYDLSIKEIAAKLNLSLSTFERTIKKIYKQTPNKYIMYRKLEKAHLLLQQTQMPVKQIAFMLGFNSVSYFAKCYRARFKETPSQTAKRN